MSASTTVTVLSIKSGRLIALTETLKSSASAISFGGLIGYQTILDSGFVFDVGIGIQMITIPDIEYEFSDGRKTTVTGTSGILPSIQLAIGWAF